jgi:hypothetical protein
VVDLDSAVEEHEFQIAVADREHQIPSAQRIASAVNCRPLKQLPDRSPSIIREVRQQQSQRQWPFEVRISAPTDEGIGEASPGGEHLDPDLARTRCRNGLLFRQFQDFGTAEPSDTDMLPRHALTVSAIVVGVMLHAAVALTGSLRECRLRRFDPLAPPSPMTAFAHSGRLESTNCGEESLG